MGPRRTASVAYFDRIASRYPDLYTEPSGAGEAFRERRDRAVELLDGAGGSLLDIGCGPGVLARELGAGRVYVGVDAAPRVVEEARRRLGPDALLVVADAARLPFVPGSFDAAVCLGVIDRLPEPGTVASELARVVRPGGRVVVSWPNAASPYALWTSWAFRPAVGLLKALVARARRHPGPPHLASPAPLWRAGAVRRLLAGAGLRLDEVVYFNFNPLLPPLDELAPSAAMHLARRLAALRAGPLRWLGAGFLASATRDPERALPYPAAPKNASNRSAT